MARKITRRDFLKGVATSATFRFAPLTPSLFAYPGPVALGSEKVQAGKASRSTIVVVKDASGTTATPKLPNSTITL